MPFDIVAFDHRVLDTTICGAQVAAKGLLATSPFQEVGFVWERMSRGL